MKKLALALVCLFSVAFFASCDPEETVVENPEPSIAVLDIEGYLNEGFEANINTPYPFGFVMASNPETGKELASLTISTVQGEYEEVYNTLTISGTEYEYRDTIMWELSRDEFLGTVTIKATVTDVDNQSKTSTMTISVFNPALPLLTSPFEWYRLGNTQTGLDEFGLYWENNQKATHAQIKPKDGVQMFFFEPEVYDATTTDIEKASLFNNAVETMHPQPVYNNVSTSANGTYNDVIGTIDAEGNTHLIHITKCVIGEFVPAGYPITISGEAK
ncbi:MAG: hypothetical protein IKT08_03700 [Bacteroidales bacterium]|nr:hypothetical protein [Bacteroidales bacterium]